MSRASVLSNEPQAHEQQKAQLNVDEENTPAPKELPASAELALPAPTDRMTDCMTDSPTGGVASSLILKFRGISCNRLVSLMSCDVSVDERKVRPTETKVISQTLFIEIKGHALVGSANLSSSPNLS